MHKRIFTLFFFLIVAYQLMSQILPKEGSKLNYRLIGFSFPVIQNANNYRIEIAAGSYFSEDSFKKNIIESVNSKTTKIVAEVPSFGKTYTWRVAYIIGRSKSINSPMYHFSTGIIPSVDTSITRLRILKNAEKNKDAFVFLDGNRALYDMTGHAIWYLPDVENLTGEYFARDLKLTPQGTITLIGEEAGYEINYNGAVLWKSPNDNNKHYHHEFTRLTNGHYMILGTELADEYLSDSLAPNESGLIVIGCDETQLTGNKKLHPGWKFNKKTQYPEVIEYDTRGNIVWEYKSSRYFTRSDLYFHKNPDGTLNTKVHDNGFYLDEKANELYISCKDISRIIKVKYPEGNTLNTYGEKFTPGAIQNMGKGFFCGQHNCRVSDEGYLLLYNNNDCNTPMLPTVIMMQQPLSQNDSLKKVWEFQCTIDDRNEEERKKLNFISGGSAYELPDHSIFVNMGGQYSKLFIVNRNKEILWSALPEKWQPDMKKWLPFSQYRASIITTRADLERLIWGTEKQE